MLTFLNSYNFFYNQLNRKNEQTKFRLILLFFFFLLLFVFPNVLRSFALVSFMSNTIKMAILFSDRTTITKNSNIFCKTSKSELLPVRAVSSVL